MKDQWYIQNDEWNLKPIRNEDWNGSFVPIAQRGMLSTRFKRYAGEFHRFEP
jgi:hypothetical protein